VEVRISEKLKSILRDPRAREQLSVAIRQAAASEQPSRQPKVTVGDRTYGVVIGQEMPLR